MSIQMRHSQTQAGKSNIKDWTKKYRNASNDVLYAAALDAVAASGVGIDEQLYVLLTGARDLPGVSLRRAQAALRWDMRPSLWSDAFLLIPNAKTLGESQLFGVPLYSRLPEFPRPERNGVITTTLDRYMDPKYDSNVALIVITPKDGELRSGLAKKMDNYVKDPNCDRARFNFWESLGVWQSYLWSFGVRPNPLREGWPIPSASFIEYICEAIGLDITPGASTRNTSPEHIWNTAKFWGQASKAQGFEISGYAIYRDEGCSLRSSDEPDAPGFLNAASAKKR